MAVHYLRLVNDNVRAFEDEREYETLHVEDFLKRLLGNIDKLEDNFISQRSAPNASDKEGEILVTRTLKPRQQYEIWKSIALCPLLHCLFLRKEKWSIFSPLYECINFSLSTLKLLMSKVLWNGAKFKPLVKTTNFANIKLSFIKVKLVILNHLTIHLNKELKVLRDRWK